MGSAQPATRPLLYVFIGCGGQPIKGDGTLMTKLPVLPQTAKNPDLALSCLTWRDTGVSPSHCVTKVIIPLLVAFLISGKPL